MGPFSRANYSSLVLSIYDAWVLHTVNPFIWRCSTKSILTPLHQRNIGRHHCDIGCGTGYYLVHNTYAPNSTITLVDIEPTPLSLTAARLGQAHPGLPIYPHQHDVLSKEALPSPSTPTVAAYDSISLTYLLHTLPVAPSVKQTVLAKAKAAVKPSGVVFGATILGHGAWHSFMGRILLRYLNGRWLANLDDQPEVFVDALKENFRDVRCDIVGSILVFEAREPK